MSDNIKRKCTPLVMVLDRFATQVRDGREPVNRLIDEALFWIMEGYGAAVSVAMHQIGMDSLMGIILKEATKRRLMEAV